MRAVAGTCYLVEWAVALWTRCVGLQEILVRNSTAAYP